MLQALAALLPLVESLGASGVAAGSTAAATGSAAGTAAAGASAGGLGASFTSIVNKVMGTVEGFKSPQQLGEGIQQAQELANVIASLKQSIGKTEDKQAEMVSSAKGRPGEVDPYTGARGAATPDRSQDPAHLQALAEIQQQRAALEKEAKAKNSQLVDLHARISQTTNPRSPIQTLGNLGGIAAGGGFLGQMFGLFGGGRGGGDSGTQGGSQLAHQIANAPRNMLPGPLAGLANWIPGMKLGQNTAQTFLQPATDLGMNSAERNVASGATQFGTDLASKTLNPFAMMRGETMTHLAKLPGLLAEWGEGLVESKKHLMQFNGTLAMAFLEAERRGLIRNIQSGQRTSGATAGLSDALQDLQDTVQPIKDTVTIVMSRGLEVLVRSFTEGVTILKTLYEIAKQMDARIAVAEAAIQMRGWGPIQAMPLDAFLKDVNKIDLTKPQRVERRR